WRSEPQMAVEVTLTMMSRRLRICGSGTSRTSVLPGPIQQLASIWSLRSVRFGPPGAAGGSWGAPGGGAHLVVYMIDVGDRLSTRLAGAGPRRPGIPRGGWRNAAGGAAPRAWVVWRGVAPAQQSRRRGAPPRSR